MSLLEVRDLEAGYGDLQVLFGVDLHVEEGEYVAIVGPNGAGKSTAMKAVVGLARHMGGEITFDGEDIAGLPPQNIIERGVGYVPQSDNVFPTLTVEENLTIGAYLLGDLPDERREVVLEQFPILGERLDQRAGNLSGGQQQMLAMRGRWSRIRRFCCSTNPLRGSRRTSSRRCSTISTGSTSAASRC